ncbi:DUF397 domain-containing protein [Streptomyces armeniacus]|uniref:DUF397 domain-containing protein n=1 Tax=Streptomyces armeniacus TaxID=83291 RepID=A0A345XWF3_9ACTN|nr:DUF397 domain-containing protein [Streptomyces armeniacus]AXK35969.1 DUF397 domain-containing protein [Streptomyces armeniacus]
MRAGTAWVKSSYSGTEGGNCVEVAAGCGVVHMRDSKDPRAGALALPAASWAAFVGYAARQTAR